VSAHSSEELISKALTMIPHVIIIDILFQDQVSAPELIKAIRCFGVLGTTKIITYTNFPENLGIDVYAVEAVEDALNLCKQAGSDLYVGRFNPSFLVEKLHSLGV
jgi:hypothetical protein